MNIFQRAALWLLQKVATAGTVRDYAVGVLNDFLARTNVAKNIKKTLAVVEIVLPIMEACIKACPEKWREDYMTLVNSVRFLYATLDDGEISQKEAEDAVAAVKLAYSEWTED